MDFIKKMYAKGNVPAFRAYADIVLTGRRSYDGPGMDINEKAVRSVIRELLIQIDESEQSKEAPINE